MYKNVTEVTYSPKNNQIIIRFESLSGLTRPFINEDLMNVLKSYPRDANVMIDTYDSEVNGNVMFNGKEL